MALHVTPLTAPRVAPHHRDAPLQSVVYDLVPATLLPSVDLSISIKSRYMTRRQLDAFDAFMKRTRRPFVLGYALGVALYPWTLVLPFEIADPLAIVAVCLCAIQSITMFASLRFDIVTQMLVTFDFWLCTIVGWSTFFVLSVIVADVPSRSLAVVIAMFGVQMNIMIDANLREARNWVWVNCIAVTVHLFIAGWSTLCLIPRQRLFALFKLGGQQVPSESFVSSGLLTVAALIARNVFRKYQAKLHRRAARKRAQILPEATPLPIVEFVSYRTMLKYVFHEIADTPVRNARGHHDNSFPLTEGVAPSGSHGPQIQRVHIRGATSQPYLQRLCHINSIDRLDARSTTLLTLCGVIDCEPSPLRRRCVKTFHAFGLMTAILAFLGGISGVRPKSQTSDLPLPGDLKRPPVIELCTFAATVLYCGPFIGLHHRRVLRKIVSSFNFTFFSAQVTAAHVCVCDFSRWTTRCVALTATSWIWIHWVLSLDALTPIVRSRIGFHIRLAAPVFALCMCSAVAMIYELVSTPTRPPSSSADEGYRDRVVWHGAIFDQSITFRVAPFFYNCVATTFALSTRLLWRLCTVPNDVLVVLDGAVACNNDVAKRVTRPFSSARASLERSRRWGSMWRQPPPRSQIRVSPSRK